MSEEHDLPVLTATTAAREATVEEEVPRPSGRKLNLGVASGRTGSRPRSGSHDATPQDRVDKDDYFPTAARPGATRTRSDDTKQALASPTARSPSFTKAPVTKFAIGNSEKKFTVKTDVLLAKVPSFVKEAKPEIMTSSNSLTAKHDNDNLRGPFVYKEFEEFSFALFVGWIEGGELHGPTDFHTLHHYLGLYAIAYRFQLEGLKNQIVDYVRRYYRDQNMTAPPFRLEFIYSSTPAANPMRRFLVTTAAYRALSGDQNEENTAGGLTEQMKKLLVKGGDIVGDYIDALLGLIKNSVADEYHDVRRGDDCVWHEHEVTQKCEPAPAPEPFEPA